MTARRMFELKRNLSLLDQRCNALKYFVYEGGMWCADEKLLSYCGHIKNNDVIIDSNKNPVMIKNVKEFYNKALQQHQLVLNEYAEEYKSIVT